MTVAAVARVIEYPGNGTAAPLDVPFSFEEVTHLRVTARVAATGVETLLANGADYNVAGAGDPNGGTVTPTAARAIGLVWIIEGATPRAQTAQFRDGFDFPAEAPEQALDRLMRVAQELDALAEDTRSRALLVPKGETAGTLGSPAANAGSFLVAGPVGGFVYAQGTGNDAALRGDLAGPAGSSLVGDTRDGSLDMALIKRMPRVTALADLRALPSGSPNVVQVDGHSDAGDGGGGVFTFVAADIVSEDDDGTIIAPDGALAGRWKNLPARAGNEPFTPERFGYSPGASAAAGLAALNKMIAAANDATSSGRILFPGPYYPYDGDLAPFTRPVHVEGAGRNCTNIAQADLAGLGFEFRTSGACTVANLRMSHSGVPEYGYHIRVATEGAEFNQGMLIDNCELLGHWNNVDLRSATQFSARGTLFGDPVSCSLSIENIVNGDTGDNHVTDCTFATSQAGAAGRVAIRLRSGGGLFLTGNKFLYHEFHLLTEMLTGVATSNVHIVNNSCEGATGVPLAFTSLGGSLNNLVVVGNQFGVQAAALIITNGPDWLQNALIGANVIRSSSTAIQLDGGTQIIILPNSFYAEAAATAILCHATATQNVTIFPQSFVGYAVEVNTGGNASVRRGVEPSGQAWLAATGAASRATFDTATVTLPDLAERVKALVDDLRTARVLA